MKLTKAETGDMIDVTVTDDDIVIGYANARISGNVMTLLAIHVRPENRRTGVGRLMMDALVADAFARDLSTLIADRVKGLASWKLLVSRLGEPVETTGCTLVEMPEQPVGDVFLPSLGILRIEGKEEVTGVWNLKATRMISSLGPTGTDECSFSIRAVALHEVGHAYAGISCGLWGSLKEISIVPCDENTARCIWHPRPGFAPPKEADGELAILLGGPVAQIFFCPESVTEWLPTLQRTVVHPWEFYKLPPLSSWRDDVAFCSGLLEKGLPPYWTSIEDQLRNLFARPTVARSIHELSEKLLSDSVISGPDAEAIFRRCLNANDAPGFAFYQTSF
jgi:hypothetical protein